MRPSVKPFFFSQGCVKCKLSDNNRPSPCGHLQKRFVHWCQSAAIDYMKICMLKQLSLTRHINIFFCAHERKATRHHCKAKQGCEAERFPRNQPEMLVGCFLMEESSSPIWTIMSIVCNQLRSLFSVSRLHVFATTLLKQTINVNQ